MKNGIKRWICLLAALCLCAACACAEGDAFRVWFEDGFSLSIPEGWVSYPVAEADAGAGFLYILGDGNGQRYMYIHAQPTELADVQALEAAIDAREDFSKSSELNLNGQAFAAFIVPGLNASGCATLMNDALYTFLFTPQDDGEYIGIVAEIMASFTLAER